MTEKALNNLKTEYGVCMCVKLCDECLCIIYKEALCSLLLKLQLHFLKVLLYTPLKGQIFKNNKVI